MVHPWAQVVSLDDSSYFKSAYVDGEGHFDLKDLPPGHYFLGLGIRPRTGYFSDVPIPVYYPGVRNKDQAAVIEIRAGETHKDADFEMPVEDVLKPLKPR